jgi:hypothetical protein
MKTKTPLCQGSSSALTRTRVHAKVLGFAVAFRSSGQSDPALPILWTSQASTFGTQKSFLSTGIFEIARRLLVVERRVK